jgi:O-antigen/teichoic acid export membrane protein
MTESTVSRVPTDPEAVEGGHVAPGVIDRASLDRSLVQGVAWTSGVKWVVQGLTWAATILVMRLLTPEDYGLMGMAGLFLGLVTLVSEFGLGSAVISLRDLTERQIAQLNSVALLVGLLAATVAVAASVPVGRFFDSPRLPPVIALLSTTFVISALNVVPAAILRRNLRYRTLAMVEGGEAVGDVAATLFLAWLGFGYWSLVLGRIMKYAVAAAAFSFLAPKRFALPRIQEIRHALTFSFHVVAGRLGWYTYSNGDYLIIGKILGQGPLGLYNSAFTLSRMPAEKITGMVTRVSPGIFSAVQHDRASLCRYILILTEGISLIAFAPIVGIGLVAPELIPVVLGDRWAGAVVPLQILSIGAAISAVTPLLPQVLHVIKETRFTMLRSFVAVLVFIPGFLVGSRWGVAGVALAWIVLEPPALTVPVLWRIRRRIGLSLREYGKALWPAGSATVTMAVAVVATRTYFSDDFSSAALLALEVVVGALVYATTLLVLHRDRVDRLVRAVRLLRS